MLEKEQRKIAFVGTSCTGKTTLIEHYRQRFSEDTTGLVVEEAARIYFEQNPDVKDRFSMSTQHALQDLILSLEKSAHEKEIPIILCDRSVLDAVAYLRSSGNLEGSKEMLEKARDWLPTYHKIFLLDPEDIPYQSDAIRTETFEDRQKFHESFLSFFMEENIEYELLSGTLDQRIAKVDEYLNSG